MGIGGGWYEHEWRAFGYGFPSAGERLGMLEEAGVVSRVVDGRTHLLSLRPEALAEASGWIDMQRERWERLFDVLGEYLEGNQQRS